MKKLLVLVCFLLSISGVASAITYDFDDIELEPNYNYLYKNYTETDFNSLFTGVSFHNTFDDPLGDVRFRILQKSLDMEADFSGNVVMSYPWSNDGITVATFDTPTDFVSITMGDRGIDPDDLYLKAYDASGNLIPEDFLASPASSFDGHTLSVSTPFATIAWVEFYGRDWWGLNTVYWDNFTFNETSPGSEVCPALWDPVCGEDGVTYSNACYADLAGITVAYEGECNDTIPDPGPDPDPSAIPEPGTLLLFGTGLLAMLALMRRTLKKK